MSGDKTWREALADIEAMLRDHGWRDTLVASTDANLCVVSIKRIRGARDGRDGLIVTLREDRAAPWSFRAVREGDTRSLRGSERFDLKLLLGGIFDPRTIHPSHPSRS